MKLIIFQQGSTNFEIDIPDDEDIKLLKEMIAVSKSVFPFKLLENNQFMEFRLKLTYQLTANCLVIMEKKY